MLTGQIYINESDRLQVDNREITSGDTLEVLIVNGLDNSVKWIDTRVEHNGEGYYLTGLLGYSIIGLFARLK